MEKRRFRVGHRLYYRNAAPKKIVLYTYEYQPLPTNDHIRRLILEPGSGKDPLIGTMEVINLKYASTLAPFEAISYVWGPDIKNQLIIIDGKPLPITTSLMDALRQMRLSDQSCAIWADSVCIDQDNKQEKGHQVAAMGRIYQTSTRTVVCLGSRPEYRTVALDVRGLISTVDLMVKDFLYRCQLCGHWDRFPWPRPDDPLLSDHRWKSWNILVSHAWFRRGWVIQEVALGRDVRVLWSGVSIEWMSILRVTLWVMRRARTPTALGLPVIHMQAFHLAQPHETMAFFPERSKEEIEVLPALHMLHYARHLQLSDPRDRIYAFMALPVKEDTMPILYPDYTRSHLNIYQDFALRYLDQTSDLDILSYAEHSEKTFADDRISSWVTNWDCGDIMHSIPRVDWAKIGRGHFAVSQDGRLLRVQSVIMDSVEYSSRIISRYGMDEEAVQEVLSLWREVSQKSTIYREPRWSLLNLALIFINTLCQGGYHGIESDFLRSIQIFAQLLQNDQPNPWKIPSYAFLTDNTYLGNFEQNFPRTSVEPYPNHDYGNPIGNTHAKLVSKCATDSSYGRRLILLGRGYYGIAPQVTRQGDVCAIIYGTRTPFILRKEVAGGRENMYKLVGPVHISSKEWSSRGLPYRLGEDQHCEDWKDWGLRNQDIYLC